jgi:hypothetical protein
MTLGRLTSRQYSVDPPELARQLQERDRELNGLLTRLESLIPASGSGSPEGSVSAVPGALYVDTDGGTGTTLYVKESGFGKTGWVAK